MRKILMILMLALMLVGCGLVPENKTEDGTVDNKTEEKEKPEDKKEEVKDDAIVKLEAGDFSGFTGVYETVNGYNFTLLESGLREGLPEDSDKAVSKNADGSYEWKSWAIDNPDSKYTAVLYPVGVSIKDLESDTSKVRIIYIYEGATITIDDIHTKVD